MLCGLAALVGGCSAGPVPVAERDLDPAEARACERLVDDLPASIGDAEHREVEPAEAAGAAWGDPAIVLTCGGEVPEGFGSTAFCQESDGVGWYVPDAALEDETVDVTMVAVGHRPIVTVVVPAELRPEGVATTSSVLAGPVKEHTELVRPCF